MLYLIIHILIEAIIIIIPNNFLKYFIGTLFKRNAPNNPPITLPKVTFNVVGKLNIPFFMYIIELNTVSGNIMDIAVACALWSSIPSKKTIKGTIIVPPPAPNNPFKIPVTKPIISNFIRLAILSPKKLFIIYSCIN